MVFNIGLRIERLLYFGFFLISLCWIELYFVEASAYFDNSQNRALETLISKLEGERLTLDKAFKEQKKLYIPKTEEELAIAEMRKKIGLEPQTIESSATNDDSYHSKLKKILTEISLHSLSDIKLSSKIDSKKSPQQLITELKAELEVGQTNSAKVFGLEVPRLLSFQYGSSDFKIPSQFLATVLLLVTQTLAIIWIGSFYITRQRELLAIRSCNDYNQAFPHILNWFIVDFSAFYEKWGVIQTRKQRKQAILTMGIITTTFRCFTILIIILLIVGPLIYSTISLSTPTFITYASGLFSAVNCIIGLQLLFNESFLLKEKVFYV